jgi:tRNA(Ile)-lysidine synthase
MAVRSGRLLRPLLTARRAETRACCGAGGLPWREDPTNAGDGPLRNRVRHRLLPLLEELRPGATRALARTAALAADERDWLDPLVAAALAGSVLEAGGVDSDTPPFPPSATLPSIALDAEALAALPVALARRVVRAAARRAGVAVPDAAATDRVLALAGAADGERTGWPGGSAARAGPALRLGLPLD